MWCVHNFATYNTTCTLLSCESYMLGNYDACQLKTFAKCSGYEDCENYPVNYNKEHIHRDRFGMPACLVGLCMVRFSRTTRNL